MSENLALISDLSSPEGALAAARNRAERVVALTKITAKTKEAAIYSLTRRYGFKSWLLKLCRGDIVPIHLDLYVRLCRALAEANRVEDERRRKDIGELAFLEGGDDAGNLSARPPAVAEAAAVGPRRPTLVSTAAA